MTEKFHSHYTDYVKSYNRMIKVSNNDLYRNVYKYVFFGTSIKEFKRVRGNEYKHAKF